MDNGRDLIGVNIAMKPIRLVLGLLLLANFAIAGEPKQDASGPHATKSALDAELEKLRGTWVVKSELVDGKPITDSYKCTFSKNICVREWEPGIYNSRPPTIVREFELDLKAVPKVMREMVPGTKSGDGGAIWQIYRFRGDKLEICHSIYRQGLSKAPAKFDGSAGTGQILITLERVKADNARPQLKQP